MPLVRERQFNLIHFLYALGTIVLLTAALFVALELDYAKELFAIGLFIEILVFIISLIEPDKEDKEYSEEIVFPPIKSSEHEKKPKFRLKRKSNADKQIPLETIQTDEVLETLASIRSTTEQLSRSIQDLQQNYRHLSINADKNQRDLKELKDKIQ